MAAKREKLPAKTARKTRASKKQAAEPRSRGLGPEDVQEGEPPPQTTALRASIAEDGGTVLGTYRDPLGGHWQILAVLPIDKVEPTPFQRDLSPAHVARLTDTIGRLDRFLDPVIAVRSEGGGYWTPNGNHRLHAMRALGARAITALVLPEREVAFRILALNTEKAHNLREKSLEVIRMARALAELDGRAEKDYALEFEEPAFLTLGLCYEGRGRFAGGAYHPLLKRVESFSGERLARALETRAGRASKLFELDDAVGAAVASLKERGFESPYLKAFVVARVNPLRFQREGAPEFDETLEKMLNAAKRFDAAKVRADQVAGAGGAPDE